jgi:hypothetical protein
MCGVCVGLDKTSLVSTKLVYSGLHMSKTFSLHMSHILEKSDTSQKSVIRHDCHKWNLQNFNSLY